MSAAATTTDAPACASPAGAIPSLSLTADAGAQTGAPVVVAVDMSEPLDTRIPTAVSVTFAGGASGVYTVYVDDGVADGRSGVTTLPYCSAPWPESTTGEQDEAAERAIVDAWLSQREAA